MHWHGIELESYYDGVPGLSGSGQRLLAPIEPGGSFVADFTPPRAGTFIYHSHFDDLKQLSSGLYGPLIVLPPGETFDPDTDRVLVISTGRTYRLRIINIVPDFEVRPDATGDLTLEVVRPANRYPAEITPSRKAVELRPESRVAVTIPVGR
ncbi:MAG TPA: multicopper oxidase domain-containing protein [Vicinamibacterales bacterium]|nr:multicopper oxidase domain-containing protein [Vicinamibacterales bacterium]